MHIFTLKKRNFLVLSSELLDSGSQKGILFNTFLAQSRNKRDIHKRKERYAKQFYFIARAVPKLVSNRT